MSSLNEYERDYQRIQTPVFTKVSFFLRGFVADWLRGAPMATETDLINNALGLAGHRQLTSKHGLQMVLRDDNNAVRELPVPAQPFVHEDDDERWENVNLTPRNQRWLDWMQEERGMTTETAVHDGVRILGSVAAAPHSRIVIPEFGDVDNAIAVNSQVNLTGAPLFIEPDG